MAPLTDISLDKRTRLVYVISDVNKALAFEWIADNLNREQFELSFVLLNSAKTELETYILQAGLPVLRIKVASKLDWPRALIQLIRFFKRTNPDVVHTHLLTANIIGLTAARLAGVKTRIYTRHHSSLHHVYHPKGIWWDRLANRLSTRVIAISGIVKEILTEWEKVPGEKIVLIPHGFRLEFFSSDKNLRKASFRHKYDLSVKGPVLGVISRFTEWKGVQYIIPAFKALREQYPDAALLLLNAQGDYAPEINKLLSGLPPESYRSIAFEPDISAAYAAMDIFIHVPVDRHSEAFGQIYVEALAAGIPSVFTLSGIAPDFIEHEKNALVVPYRDSAGIFDSVKRLLESSDLRNTFTESGPASVKDRFRLETMISSLEELYRASSC